MRQKNHILKYEHVDLKLYVFYKMCVLNNYPDSQKLKYKLSYSSKDPSNIRPLPPLPVFKLRLHTTATKNEG